ncbi:MAG TPA: TetR/AcrR family transcriptional regulator [Nevskiaceae bacterium]|nr:TetR/AcrR family transcriptional regulator [Nevskiaceae bacterium]
MTLGQRTKPKERAAGRSAAGDGGGATDRRILEHARRAFNERGVGAVGIREIARELGLSPGNVSYHFPTKEALITAMIREGHALNNAVLRPPSPLRDFEDLFARLRAIMQRDLDHRWLLRDYAGLMVSMPGLRAQHQELQGPREARVDTVLAELIGAGLLDGDKVERRVAELRRQIFTQIFFWLPSAAVSAPGGDPAASLEPCARAVMALFLPYCTAAGRRSLEALLDRG